MQFANRSVGSVVLGVLVLAAVGCQRAEPVQWAASEQVQSLAPELAAQVSAAVQAHSGTVLLPKMLTDITPKSERDKYARELTLKHGQDVYMKRCVQCHGVSGDGNGPVAASLYPRPRDYRRGIFKFTSTPYGSRPRREDLIATLDRGIVGTSMPSFSLLPKKDIEAVVDYVLVLAQRGELEYQLASEAEASEELLEEDVPDYVDVVANNWRQAAISLTQPLTPQPELTPERVALGREAFLSKGCSKCHGDDGRGHTKDNIGKDSWGHSTRAADLTSGMLHGGQDPVDIYRRIMNGINGTPMPGFKNSLESEPETIWNLVSYVLSVSNRRREGTAIPAGLMKPYADPIATEEAGEAPVEE
ncbi:MAG TPA: c-type cytochrome [Planctomycetaceae bacterium]|nr:c-type cytochrome [Planctomycetaceae bacterium]